MSLQCTTNDKILSAVSGQWSAVVSKEDGS